MLNLMFGHIKALDCIFVFLQNQFDEFKIEVYFWCEMYLWWAYISVNVFKLTVFIFLFPL